ncbi:conserved hypothetical protein [Talaromyces stipitatus ATCC 10500]|uniref:Glyoxal oxidase n=1 Tax=Talaromyces stipitatus (strain ATCC 10500 / CBS 375.48 / QM 6759 / NRRL 1006) TaxID=441959 RepID=B8MMH2_TALSN|nr:uncharacterized protein TSTA_099760 [Talaromyces stipitatus ATCC 10500]EED13726.1 conserved hypothetical protein [Talaromyces stipitatus ATCC 10500]
MLIKDDLDNGDNVLNVGGELLHHDKCICIGRNTMRLTRLYISFFVYHATSQSLLRFASPDHDVQAISSESEQNDAEHMASHGAQSSFVPLETTEQSSVSPFRVVGQSGVPAMAAALMPNGNVVFIDKVENYTQLVLDNGQYAYSSEYNLTSNTAHGLGYQTNAFCSGGSFLADGRLVSVGGNGPLPDIDPTVGDGFQGIRYLERGAYYGDWYEPGHTLSTPRWYASVQMLQGKELFVASGSLNGLDPMRSENNNPTFEILDQDGIPATGSIILPILSDNQPYYMYPFLHLLKNGHLFIFVSRSAEVYNPYDLTTSRQLPNLPGAYRTYPNTGGSVILPLSKKNDWEPEIMVCGGGAYADISSPADRTCGRIQPLSENPEWHMEEMPEPRVMVEGLLLPDGKVLWLNGARRGAQGFGTAQEPCFGAFIYDPEQPTGSRWALEGTSDIPRLYHSVALLLLDGTVMVAGSNPMEQPLLEPNYNSPATAYATEFRVEIYTPPYLLGANASKRPQNIQLSQVDLIADGESFFISFTSTANATDLKIALYHGGFVTHSLHMGQRLIYLDHEGFAPGFDEQFVSVFMPPSSSISPSGPYVIYVVLDGVPGLGQFVMVR